MFSGGFCFQHSSIDAGRGSFYCKAIFRLSLVTNRQSVQVNRSRRTGLRHFAGAGSQTILNNLNSIQNLQNFLRADLRAYTLA